MRDTLRNMKWWWNALITAPPHVALFPPGSERYATRSMEAYLAWLDLLFGFVVVLPFWNTLQPEVYAPLLAIMPQEEFWGLLLMARGLFHLVSLRINGRAWWTPYARAIASGCSAVFWFVFVLALWWTVPFRPGLIFCMGTINVYAHLYCLRRSGRDAGMAYASHYG